MSTCRFLKEYANFKKRKLAEQLTWAWTKPQVDNANQGIETINKILEGAHAGIITLDEAMEIIARV